MLISELSAYLQKFIWNSHLANLTAVTAVIAAIFIISYLIQIITRRFVLAFFRSVFQKSKSVEILIEHRFFSRLFHLLPAIIFYSCAALNTGTGEIMRFVHRIAIIYVVLVLCSIFSSVMKTIDDLYHKHFFSRRRPIKSYLQMLSVLVYTVAGIFIVSVLLHQSSWDLIKAIGAMTAVVLLIFKDSILGLVASIQLSVDDMVRKGDWIEMPKHNADGIVTDISLNTVKVRNWDHTITTIPAHNLIEYSFKNWRAMEESGGRQIKRAILIDMNSIKFCDDRILDKLSRIDILKDHIDTKKVELEKFNGESKAATESSPLNGRRLTNIGLFREYLKRYLQQHHLIEDRKMLFFIRHLEPNEHGLPIQIFSFCKNVEWTDYEEIQADIFDHIIASVPEFELRIHQTPGGHDIRSLGALKQKQDIK